MNTVEILLLLVGLPLAVIAVLALLTLRGGRKRLRYKPGQPWDHAPVWYEPHPENGGSGAHGPAPAHGPAAVPGSSTSALGSSMYPEQSEERNTDTHGAASVSHGATSVSHGATSVSHGAASDSHGAATGSHAASLGYPPVDAGPLGGARGTW